jgi:hypothetical protein
MISVGENDIGPGASHIVMMHAFDRGLRADRHESRRTHYAMRGRDFAAPRGAVRRDQAKREWARHGVLFRA